MAESELPSYGSRHPAPYLSVDLVIITVEDGVLKVVLTERRDPWRGSVYALPGEMAFERVSLEMVARRHLLHRLGLEMELDLVHVASDPDRDPRGRVISAAYLGLIEAYRLREAVDAIPGLVLADIELDPMVHLSMLHLDDRRIEPVQDHESIIAAAIAVIRERLEGSLLAFRLIGQRFTLLELQQVYEAILGHPLNKITFRKHILAKRFPGDRWIIKTGLEERGPYRPAAYYQLF